MLCRQLPLFVEKQMYLKLGSLLLLGCRVLFSIHSHCRHEYGWILNAICRVSECKQIISTVCLTFWHLRGVVAYRMALQSTRIGWMIHTTKAQQICADNIKTIKKKKKPCSRGGVSFWVTRLDSGFMHAWLHRPCLSCIYILDLCAQFPPYHLWSYGQHKSNTILDSKEKRKVALRLGNYSWKHIWYTKHLVLSSI